MKKRWFILILCFMLMLSGCKAEKPQDDELAETITEEVPENVPSDEITETPEPTPDNTDAESIYLTAESVEVKYAGDGFVVFNAFNSLDPYVSTINFKCYTDFKYAKEQDTALFSGELIPLEEGEYFQGRAYATHIAKENTVIKFGFDPDDLDVRGSVSQAGDGYIIVSVRYRNIKVYVENAEEYCIGDNVYIKGKAESVQPYTEGKYEISFEVKDAEIEIQEEIADAKPVIYLYPEKETEVNVKLTYDGKLTCVYPEYNGGWTVRARPDGTLYDKNGREYYCLYWEGQPNTPRVYDKNVGFVVKGSDTAEFLREKLLYLGLNEREANEFIIYWLPQMEDNNYNYIYFSGEEYTKSARLDIDPAPDTLIRVMMVWEPLDIPRRVTEQKLEKAPERNGFTAVEWGGTKIK